LFLLQVLIFYILLCVKEYIRATIFEIALIFEALFIANKNNKKEEKKDFVI